MADDEDITFERTREAKWMRDQPNVYQADDGYYFYYDRNKLFVIWKNQRFDSASDVDVQGATGMGVVGNTLYFAKLKQLFKAEFKCPRLTISIIRELEESEEVVSNAILTSVRNGKTHAYRMDQDPEKDAIEIPEGQPVLGIVGKQVFLISEERNPYWLWDSNDNTYLINEIADQLDRQLVYARQDSPFIYVTCGRKLALIYDGQMKPIAFRGIPAIHSIIGIRNGVLSVLAKSSGKLNIWEARLRNLEGEQSPTNLILDRMHYMKKELSIAVNYNLARIGELAEWQEKANKELATINKSLQRIQRSNDDEHGETNSATSRNNREQNEKDESDSVDDGSLDAFITQMCTMNEQYQQISIPPNFRMERNEGVPEKRERGTVLRSGAPDKSSSTRMKREKVRETDSSRFDSGTEPLDALEQCHLRLYLEEVVGRPSRPATKEELERYARTVQSEVEERLLRRQEMNSDEAGPSNERIRGRALLMNRYLNHSNPDLAMAEEEEERREAEERERRELEEQERREADEKREDEERRRVQEARARQREARDRDNQADFDDESVSSALTAEEQRELVRALRDSLAQRSTEGMEPSHQRLIAHLRRALDENGGISREEIMRYRVEETNRASRERQVPDRNSPYSVSSVVISRMSLGEIGARADAIRALSSSNIYPLEIYYQLHLADVVWPLAGRDVRMGDNVYTHDEINRVLGADSPVVPPGADSEDFHQLMRKRAITAASLTGRGYGRRRGSEGFQYQPPRLPDQGVYQLLQDPSVLLSAIEGDMEPLREAIERIPMTMPDVMRLDRRSDRTLGTHLHHFRDYLDSRARMAGFELRDDIYQDVVPPEPTGSRRQQRGEPNEDANGNEEEDPNPQDDEPEIDPAF